jgi:mannose-6-phosphate isomerase-like protein (cupin superfamily)
MKKSKTRATKPKASYVHIDRVKWRGTRSYPAELKRVYRYKPLIGGTDWYPGWRGVPLEDIATGILELDPGGYYPLHMHPAPEIYYVISGKAKWTVGRETFLARPGMAIYHSPRTVHRMVNTGKEKLRTFWIWWAPGGKTEVLNVSSRLVEPMPTSKARKPRGRVGKRGRL